MNTDAVLRMLIGVLGLMPTTFFLMQTLEMAGIDYKGADPADHLQYSFMQRERIYEFAE